MPCPQRLIEASLSVPFWFDLMSCDTAQPELANQGQPLKRPCVRQLASGSGGPSVSMSGLFLCQQIHAEGLQCLIGSSQKHAFFCQIVLRSGWAPA